MTLRQCLLEIRKHYLNESTEEMNRVGLMLIHEIKTKHFSHEIYPRTGWLLFMNGKDGLFVVNKGIRVKVNLPKKKVQKSFGEDVGYGTKTRNYVDLIRKSRLDYQKKFQS